MAQAREDDVAAEHTIDVAQMIEGRKLNGFIVRLLVLSTLITFFDGYDLQSLSFAAPQIVRDLHIPRASFGQIFAVGLFGIMLGGFMFGWLGDRIGRRPSIIIAAACFGVLTFATAFASNAMEFTVLRFVDGLAIGGLVPVAWVLNIEFAPKRFRATAVTIIMLGYSVGSSLGGFISAWLIPVYGWQVVFYIGGVAPLLVAALLQLALPESIKFLTVKNRRPQEIARLMRRVRPDMLVPHNARFIVGDEAGAPKAENFQPGLLFRGRLGMMTPLLWLAYIGSSMAVFFLSSWMPTLAEASGLTPSSAALGSSMLSLGGAVGGLLLMRFVDHFGAIAVAVMPVIACPLVAMLGMISFDGSSFMIYMLVVGIFVIGGHTGLHSIAGLFYPSAYRSNGAGWATSVAKVGSISGPWIGGALLGAHMPLPDIFLFAAMPPVLFAVCILPLGLLHRKLMEDERSADLAAQGARA
jgi:AAHS family 4-hydroxybenzoate transporter-like MFS transporter